MMSVLCQWFVARFFPAQAKVTTELSQVLDDEEKRWMETLQIEEYQITLAKTVIEVTPNLLPPHAPSSLWLLHTLREWVCAPPWKAFPVCLNTGYNQSEVLHKGLFRCISYADCFLGLSFNCSQSQHQTFPHLSLCHTHRHSFIQICTESSCCPLVAEAGVA